MAAGGDACGLGPPAPWRALAAAVDGLQEELSALRECLLASGALSAEGLSARLHRRRFAAARLAHPCAWEASLARALQDGGLSLTIASIAGPGAVRSLRAASRAMVGSLQLANAPLPARRPLLYVAGGADAEVPQRELEAFDPATLTWETLSPMSCARSIASSAVIGGRLYVCGGFEDCEARTVLDTAECFEPAAGAWRALPRMLQGRADAAHAVIGDRLYVSGGVASEDVVLGSAEVLEAGGAAERWRGLPPMAYPRQGACAAVLRQRVVVCGGWNSSCGNMSFMESFLPGAEEWEPLPPMAHRRSDASSAVVGERLYVCGGLDETEAASTAVERYDPEAGAWETLAPMAVGRLVASLAAIEGRLYVCGGSGAVPTGGDDAEGAEEEEAGAEPLRHCACFDPEADGGRGQWQDLPPMADPRCSAGAAVLGGALYICGGEGADGGALAGAERFDPRAGAWERLPAMRLARSFPSSEAL